MGTKRSKMTINKKNMTGKIGGNVGSFDNVKENRVIREEVHLYQILPPYLIPFISTTFSTPSSLQYLQPI